METQKNVAAIDIKIVWLGRNEIMFFPSKIRNIRFKKKKKQKAVLAACTLHNHSTKRHMK